MKQAPPLLTTINLAPRGSVGATRGTIEWIEDDSAYLLEGHGTQYRVALGTPGDQSSLLRVEARLEGTESGEWHTLLWCCGMLARGSDGPILSPLALQQQTEVTEIRHTIRGRSLALEYAEKIEDQPRRRTVFLRPFGRSLEIHVEGPGGRAGEGYCGFSLGALESESPRFIPITGLPEPLVVMGAGGFASGYPDRYLGAATTYPPGAALYRPDTEGVTRPVRETFYVTYSSDPLDPLPALRRQAAALRSDLETRITLDYYSECTFAEDERLLSLLPLYGLQDVLLIYRNWQQFGYRRRAPLMYPADPNRGSNELFRRLIARAKDAGWLVALREEYATITSDSPYWNEKAVATWFDGSLRQTRFRGQYAVAADRMLDFARLEATKIQRNYGPNAAFVDGHTAWNPEEGLRQVDASPNSRCGTETEAMAYVEALLGFLREVHGGPVIGSGGEGAARFDTLAEGMAEAVIRGPDGGLEAPLLVDYELREVRPRLMGLGAGPYRQFCGHATGEAVPANKVDWDAYRATEIALGHAGYVSNYRIKPGPRGIPFPGGSAATAVREYYMLRALQELYLGTPVRRIAYRWGAEFLDLGEALQGEVDLFNAQIRVEYANGLTVWVNRSGADNWSIEAEGERWELPPSGFLALAPRQRLIAYSALLNGQRTDFCRSAAYTFLDVREPRPRAVEGLRVDGAAALLPGAVTGRLDIVLVSAKQLELEDGEYLLSERGDLRLRHRSPAEVEVTVMDSESGKPIHVTWPAFTEAWKKGPFRVTEREGGPWLASRCQVQPTRSGPQLSRARPGATYRIALPE